MAICGAKNRQGEPCRKSPLKGKTRCKLHGGLAGAPKNNKNNVKHNIYSKFLTKEEQQITAGLDLSSIDDELKLTKARLMRVLQLEEQQSKLLGDDVLEPTALSTTPTLFGGIPDYNEPLVESRSYVKKDYGAMIDRLTARIANLTQLRCNLELQSIASQTRILELEKLKREINPPEERPPTDDYRLPIEPDEDMPHEPIL